MIGRVCCDAFSNAFWLVLLLLLVGGGWVSLGVWSD